MSDPESAEIDHEDEQKVTVPRWVMLACKGDARDAMVLAQILYWLQSPLRGNRTHRTDRIVSRDGLGWMWMTDADFAKTLGMTRQQVQRARLALVKAGLVQCKSAKVSGEKVTLARPTIVGLREIEQYVVTASQQTLNVRDETLDPRADVSNSRSREDARSRARAIPIPEDWNEDCTPASGDAEESASSSVVPHATDDPLKTCARDLARLAFEQIPKPISPFPAVMERCTEALIAGYAVQAIERLIRMGDVVWTRDGLTYALAKSKTTSGPLLEDRVAANRRLAHEMIR